MQGFSVESKTSGISSSSTLWQDLEVRTSHAMKQTWLQEVRDLIQEDDKLRGPNQKSAESCKTRVMPNSERNWWHGPTCRRGKHLEDTGTNVEQRRPRAGPGWAQAGRPSPVQGPFVPSFALAAIRAIYSPGVERHGGYNSSSTAEEQRREGHHPGEERVELVD
jgi:hypothetical protein